MFIYTTKTGMRAICSCLHLPCSSRTCPYGGCSLGSAERTSLFGAAKQSLVSLPLQGKDCPRWEAEPSSLSSDKSTLHRSFVTSVKLVRPKQSQMNSEGTNIRFLKDNIGSIHSKSLKT